MPDSLPSTRYRLDRTFKDFKKLASSELIIALQAPCITIKDSERHRERSTSTEERPTTPEGGLSVNTGEVGVGYGVSSQRGRPPPAVTFNIALNLSLDNPNFA